MPEKQTRRRAAKARREGKSASTQAGEYVREEMHHKRSGKHKIKNRKQAIAIGLSKARRAGVSVPDKGKRKSSRGGAKSRSTSRNSSRSSRGRSGSSRGGSSSRSRSSGRKSSRSKSSSR